MKTWNRERKRTRDLLLEYDLAIMPPRPRSGGLVVLYPWGSSSYDNMVDIPIPHSPHTTTLAMVYPWEDISLTQFNNQLYLVAVQNGFEGSIDDFKNLFASFVGARSIFFSTYDAFPAQGITNRLYFDLDEKILYYWDNEYIPINAMLIANTTVNGGEA